ncbi:unannotated protein [freshwater metagenome]|uniref:Unannotated protein n=1 Tax=freshwater metagenome TaxID=449393 RepID=A0A6J6E772_9ZZZZ
MSWDILLGEELLHFADKKLIYKLSPLEMLGALRGTPSARVENLISVQLHQDPWTSKVLRGIRAPGTGFPFVIMLGTLRHRFGKDFSVVYRRRPVLLLEFENESFARWIIPAAEENIKLLSSLNPNWPKLATENSSGAAKA